jgi:hypothetical protein
MSFESISLQQRVRCELASLGLALSLPLGRTAVESRAPMLGQIADARPWIWITLG